MHEAQGHVPCRSEATRTPADRLEISYVVPLKADRADVDLVEHLGSIVDAVTDVVVVDASSEEVFDVHHRTLPPGVRHVRPRLETPMGKVGNVLTGLDLARNDVVVIAADDVRWTPELLRRAVAGLDGAEVARPQNAFDPAPWHARWDTGRILLNRVAGGDWPGTLLVRRSALPHGYAGDVLFENLELVRTVRAAGGRERLLLDVIVPRRPPTTRRFLDQRVRQAYDEFARPGRLLVQLVLLPLVAIGRGRAIAAVSVGGVLAAEAGRRRGRGARAWPASASWWAPLWIAERAVTSSIAVGVRLRGGVRYRGSSLRLAAHPTRHLAAGLRRPGAPGS